MRTGTIYAYASYQPEDDDHDDDIIYLPLGPRILARITCHATPGYSSPLFFQHQEKNIGEEVIINTVHDITPERRGSTCLSSSAGRFRLPVVVPIVPDQLLCRQREAGHCRNYLGESRCTEVSAAAQGVISLLIENFYA